MGGKTVAIERQTLKRSGPKLKASSGWFAAGVSFHQALTKLSDGAFKLFAHVCLKADRGTGRYEATQTELSRMLSKSRRVVGKYIAELQREGICTVCCGRNQYARNVFEILDEYWPYDRTSIDEEANRKEQNEFIAVVRDRFLATGCTRGTFGPRDEKTARVLKERGVSLDLLQDALILGAARKYASWLDGGTHEPIASLRYFEPLISEIKD